MEESDVIIKAGSAAHTMEAISPGLFLEGFLVAGIRDMTRIVGNVAHGTQRELSMSLFQLCVSFLARRIAALALDLATTEDWGVLGHLLPLLTGGREGSVRMSPFRLRIQKGFDR